MVMSAGWFGDALDAAQAKADEEEKLRQIQAQANAGDVPVAAPAPSPAGAFFGQQLSQPAPPPPPPVMTPAGLEDIQAPIGSLRAQSLGQPEPQGFVPTVPQGYTESPLTTAARVAAGPAQIYEGLNADIPYWSDFARDYAIPAVNAAADPLGIGSFIQRNTIGTDIGAGDVVVPVGAADVGLNLATGGGLTGFDDLARMGSTGLKTADNVFRGVPSEPGQVYRLGVQPDSLIGVPDQNGLAASLGAMRVGDPAGVRILGPDEALNPGEQLMYHGGRIDGPVRPEMFVTPNLTNAETFARTYGAFNAQPGLVERISRAFTPEPTGYPGLGSPGMGPGEAGDVLRAGGFSQDEINAFSASMNMAPPGTIENAVDASRGAAREAYGQGGTPAAREAAASTYDNLVNGTPTAPAFPSSYPSIPEGTMGSEFPWARDMQDAARGGTPPSQAQIDALIRAGVSPETASLPVREVPIDPNSPAARMGTPLSGDPQFMTPPDADAAMRNLGVGPEEPFDPVNQARINLAERQADAFRRGVPQPVDDTARQMRDAFQNVRRQEDILTGGGVPRVEPTQSTPPPASTPEIAPEIAPPASPSVTIGGPNTFETGHQTLAPVIERPTPPPTEVAQLRDELRQLREAIQANGAPPRWAEPPSGGGRSGGNAGGATPNGGTPKGQGAIGAIRDALYTPFGFDLSSLLRQDVMRTLNPFRLFETVQVLKDSSRAVASRDAALRIGADLEARSKALGVNMHLPDWQGGDIVNREAMYSKLLNNLPGYEALNRGFATEIASRRVNALESFAKNHPGADLQHEANRLERMTGRGSFGSGSVEKALSTAGPAFTALRYTLSMPQRAASLIPFQKLTDGSFQMFGPSWRESVIDHAGFVTTVAATMAAAQQAGLKVGWDPNNQTASGDGKVPFGTIQLPNGTFIDLTGGSKKYVNAVMQLATGEKNGKDYPWLLERYTDFKGNESYRGTVGEFLRNLSGPTVQFPIAAAKEAGAKGRGLEFMRPDLWDQGVTHKGTFADRAAQFVVPLWIQDVADAVVNSAKGDHLPSQIGAGAAAFFGAGAQTYERRPLEDAREAVKNDPALPPELQGVPYKELGPDAKAAVDKLAEQKDPEGYKAGKEEQAKNSNPVFEKYRETTAKIQQTVDERSTKLYDALREGRINGEQVRQGREIINSSAKAQRDAARNDPDYKKALSELEKNEVAKALDAYYKIWDSTPKLADGKVDYDKIELRQSQFLKFAEQKDPETAKLLRFELNTEKDRTNPLEKLYDLAKPMLERYGNIKDDYARSQAQRNNPREDAFLALLGYGKPQSPEAAQLLQQMRQSLPASNVPVAAGASTKPVSMSTAAPPPIAANPSAAMPAAPIKDYAFPVQGYSGKNVELHWGSDKGGADLFAPRGTPVLAMRGGEVVAVGTTGLGGNNVTIKGSDGNQYYYAHGDRTPQVKVGETIPTGHFLFGVGDSGNAKGTGTHLHIGIGPEINRGSGPTGGSGKNFDAVGLMNSVLTGQTGPAPVGPDGRTVAQITGNPYLSDAERTWYFESRGLPIPTPGVAAPARINAPATGGGGSAYTMDANGRTPPIAATDIAPIAEKYGVPANAFARLMNHEGNGAPDRSEKGVQPARWGIVESTAKQYGVKDTMSLTPEQAYDIAGQYLSKGMEANTGDASRAFASYFIGQGNVNKAVAQGGDWVKNADQIAAQYGYSGGAMTKFLDYLGLR